MSWVTVGVAAVGATSGYLKGKRNEKIADANSKFRKAAIQYSPWTKMSDPGAGPMGPGAMEAGLGGGLQGAMMGSALSNAGGAAAPTSGALGADMSGAGGAAPGITMSDAPMVNGMDPSMDPNSLLDPSMGAGKMGKWNQMMKMMG